MAVDDHPRVVSRLAQVGRSVGRAQQRQEVAAKPRIRLADAAQVVLRAIGTGLQIAEALARPCDDVRELVVGGERAAAYGVFCVT
jgi:hypothetical protein